MATQEREAVAHWLDHLAQSADLGELGLDNDGRCLLGYGDDLELVLEVPEGSSSLYLLAYIRRLEDGTGSARLYEELLDANFMLLETNGAAFAIDQTAGAIVLCYAQPVGSLDATGFVNLFGRFIETAESWQERLRAAGHATDLDADTTGPTDLTRLV